MPSFSYPSATDRRHAKTALCTKVHRAVKMNHLLATNAPDKTKLVIRLCLYETAEKS